ncbi:MAG: hypothetical protein LKE36_00325 [Bacilli bacterium]|jgi:RecJ-like exonuclease|nr:hypothetical protein [Bacilli bacterium]
MDKERTEYKAKLLNLIAMIGDKENQRHVIAILEKTEEKLPDSKVKDKIQKMIRKNKSYYDKADALITDILDHKLDINQRNIVLECLASLRAIIEGQQKNWWDQFVEWFNNATGKN